MRILIIRPYATVPNINHYNLQHIGLAKAFLRKGHICDIVYWCSTKDEYEQTIDTEYGTLKIYWLKGKVIEKSVIFNKKKIDNLVLKYDIVQTEEYEQLFSCYLAKKYPNKTVIYHGPYKSQFTKRYNLKSFFYDIIFRRSLKKHDVQFITKTECAKKSLIDKGFENIEVSPVGLDITNFSNYSIEPSNLNINKRPLKLLYIGQLCDRRCILFLLDIIKCLSDKGTEVSLTIVGKGDPLYEEQCRKHMSDLGIEHSIFFLGTKSQDELPEIYSQHDILLLATKYEIFGMVVLESMYFGKLVIASREGGIEAIIKNKYNGILIEDFNPDTWTTEIQKVINNEYDYSKMVNAARKTILDHFTWDESADCFIEIYRRKLGEPV